jgi:hypothetical protein
MVRGMRGGSNRVNVHHGDEAETPRMMKSSPSSISHATMINTTPTSKTSFHKKYFLGPCGAKDRGNITARKFHSTKNKTMLFIYKNNAQQGGEAYASSGSRSNHSATACATSSTPALAASASSLMGPCTTGYRETLGSQLRKLISTCSATTYARAKHYFSRWLPTTSYSWDILVLTKPRSRSTAPASGAVSLVPTGLKPKDTKVASSWPRKLQTRCAILA